MDGAGDLELEVVLNKVADTIGTLNIEAMNISVESKISEPDSVLVKAPTNLREEADQGKDEEVWKFVMESERDEPKLEVAVLEHLMQKHNKFWIKELLEKLNKVRDLAQDEDSNKESIRSLLEEEEKLLTKFDSVLSKFIMEATLPPSKLNMSNAGASGGLKPDLGQHRDGSDLGPDDTLSTELKRLEILLTKLENLEPVRSRLTGNSREEDSTMEQNEALKKTVARLQIQLQEYAVRYTTLEASKKILEKQLKQKEALIKHLEERECKPRQTRSAKGRQCNTLASK